MAPPPSARRGRKRKQVAHYSDDNPSTFTTKHKEGNNVQVAAVSNRTKKDARTTTTTPKNTARRKRPQQLKDEQQVQDDTNDDVVVHDHDMRLYPILPENLLPSSSSSKNNVIFGQGLGPRRSLPEPEWQLVSTPHMTGLQNLHGKRKKVVPPRLTCMDIAFGESNYAVFGNALGQVLVYALQPLVIHVATLETTASRRCDTKPFSLKQRKSEENAVTSISFCQEYIVLATACEVECYHVVTHDKLWSLPIDNTTTTVTKLDIHPTTRQVLVCVTTTDDNVSPCWLLTHEKGENVKVEKNVLPSSVLRCDAMWDRSSLENNGIVAVTTLKNEAKPQQVLKMTRNSAGETTILHSKNMPVTRTSKSIESISQSSPTGMYTCVASSKGIRLYLSSTFELLKTFGEGLALHGHGLHYQQALLFSELPEDEYHNGTGVLVVGIPHAHREPRELQEQLQLWQWWDSVHPIHTLSGPPRSLGLSQVYSVNGNFLLALTLAGDVWMLSPTATTDWPGVMYPPGYHVIDDNLIYIEDEDELDKVVETPVDEFTEPETLDDELAEALRQSMLEHASSNPKEENVIVMNHDGKDDGTIVIPCHPDPALKDAIEQNANLLSSPKRFVQGKELPACFLRQVLEIMPTRGFAEKTTRGVKVLEATANAPVKPTRGKRSRAGNLEAMIRASIDPELQKFMTAKEEWASGTGSILRDADKVPLKTNKEQETKSAVPTERAAVSKDETAAAVSSSGGTIEPTQGDVAQSRINVSTTETMNGGTAVHGFGQNVEEVTKKAISKVVASRPMDDAATSALEGMLALQRSFSEDNSPRKSAASPSSRVPPVPQFDDQTESTMPVERAEQTPPAGNVNTPSDAGKIADAGTTQTMEIDEQAGSSNGGHDAQALPQDDEKPASVTSIEIGTVATAGNTVGSASDGNVPGERHVVSQSEGSSPQLSNVAGKEVDGTGANRDSQSAATTAPTPAFCSACQGRMVIHTCGKREIPLDLEAIERAEKEKLEKAEEEKKRLRAEKRRQADARRREAKKQKKLEEERQRKREEERRRKLEKELERSRQQAEERFSGDHAERDRRRAEMWQRLMAAEVGDRRGESYGSQVNQGGQIDAAAVQPTFSQVQPSYGQTQGMQQSVSLYSQQQPYYQQSYQEPAAVQQPYSSQQEHVPVTQQIDGNTASQVAYSRASPLQQEAPQPTGFSASHEQMSSTQQQYPEAYQPQQSTPATQSSSASTPLSGQSTDVTQQRRGSPYEQSQTQYAYQPRSDDQGTPQRPLLERRSSAQLGTAEALASLASMCVQMPRAPTPQQSPHHTSGANGMSESTSVNSHTQPSSMSVAESLNQSQPLNAEQRETSTPHDATPVNASVDSGTGVITQTSSALVGDSPNPPPSESLPSVNGEPAAQMDGMAVSTSAESHPQPSSAVVGESLNDSQTPSSAQVETATDSQPPSSAQAETATEHDVGDSNPSANGGDVVSMEVANGQGSHAEANTASPPKVAPVEVTPFGSSPGTRAEEGNEVKQYVVAPDAPVTNEGNVEASSQPEPLAEQNPTPAAAAETVKD